MYKILRCLALVFFAILAACSCRDSSANAQFWQQWMQSNGKIKVLSTIAMIDDLVKQIGGEFVDSAVLIKGELDPHSYQLVKGDDEKFAFADIIFFNGLGLEHGPSIQGYLVNSSKAIPLGDRIMKQTPDQILFYKGQADPHIWLDISLWARTIPVIAETLSQKDPIHAENYRSNAAKLTEELTKAHQQVKSRLQEIPPAKRYFVTSHDAFSYFTRAYLAEPGEEEATWRLRFVSPEGLAPESQISVTDIQAIIEHLGRFHIHVLFPESNVNRDSIRKIVHAAQEKGVPVIIAEVPLYADAMGKPESDGGTYVKMLLHNANAIASHLKKNGG